MLARRYELYILVARTISHVFDALTRKMLFLPLGHKIHSVWPSHDIRFITAFASTDEYGVEAKTNIKPSAIFTFMKKAYDDLLIELSCINICCSYVVFLLKHEIAI